MIELDGIQYNVRTPEENAENMLGFINDYCTTNNITNSKGELVQIEQNWTNPLYLILYGFSYLVTVLQKLIYNVGCSLDIARASDRQVMNIAEIANVKRKDATRTTVQAMLYADLVVGMGEGQSPCHITKDLVITTNYGSSVISFSPAYETTIPVGGAVSMVLICNQEGSYSIPAGSFTHFDTPVEGLRTIVSSASVPGQDRESIADLRTRIQERATTSTQLDRAAADITQLDGVSLCNIYFNYSNTSDVVINDITVPPRQALLFVQGYSDYIARTFYNHLSCLTAGKDSPTAIPQIYTTHAGQQLPVYIIPPTVIYPNIVIYLNEQVTADVNQGIKDAISSLASSMSIGQTLTSTMIINKIQKAYPSLALAGIEISPDEITWGHQLEAQPFQLIGFNTDNMRLSEPASEE